MNCRQSAELLNCKGRGRPGLLACRHPPKLRIGIQAGSLQYARNPVPTPYKTPGDLKRGMTTEERDAALGAELGADAVVDPLASPAPRHSSPGPQTPPHFTDADIEIPSIAMPPASPVTHAENQLLETEPNSPMIISSSSTFAVSTLMFSRAPGSTTSSARGTPISEVSPLVLVTPPPGLGRGVSRYAHAQGLPQQTAFADAMRRNRVQEDPEDPIPKERDPDWM